MRGKVCPEMCRELMEKRGATANKVTMRYIMQLLTCRSRCLKILIWIAVIIVTYCGSGGPAMTWGGESPLPEILVLN